MSIDLIAGARPIHEQPITKRFDEGSNEVSLTDAFKMLAPDLLTLFRSAPKDPKRPQFGTNEQ
jgi:hypothetical protein